MHRKNIQKTKLNIITNCPELQYMLKAYKMDTITLSHANKLLQSILDCRPTDTTCKCMSPIYASAEYFIGPSVGNNSENNKLVINNLCCVKHCLCDEKFTQEKTNSSVRRIHCFCQLAAGKCIDEYTQNTLGRILFPKKYTAKQK